MGWGNFGCCDNFGYHFFIPLHNGAYELWLGQYTIQYWYELIWKMMAAKITLDSNVPQLNSTIKRKYSALTHNNSAVPLKRGQFWKKYSQKTPHSLPLPHPNRQAMGCLLWIQDLTDILPKFLQLFMQCLTTLDHVIMALDYIYTRVLISATWRHNNSTILSL